MENKAENVKRSIISIQEALKIYTIDNSPNNYATSQINLSTAFLLLAELENEAENIDKAVNALKEALKVYTEERYPEKFKLITSTIQEIFKRSKESS